MRIYRVAFGFLSFVAIVLAILARRSVFIVGATTVVEDAQGFPDKGRLMLDFIQNQPAAWFYGALLVLAAIGAALLVPHDSWARWWAALKARLGRPTSPADGAAGKDHNVTSYAQAGGITAHTVYAKDDREDDRRPEEK